jgi:hypothetical protein
MEQRELRPSAYRQNKRVDGTHIRTFKRRTAPMRTLMVRIEITVFTPWKAA